VNDQEIKLEFINTNEQLADGFTKAVTLEKLQQLKIHARITN